MIDQGARIASQQRDQVMDNLAAETVQNQKSQEVGIKFNTVVQEQEKALQEQPPAPPVLPEQKSPEPEEEPGTITKHAMA